MKKIFYFTFVLPLFPGDRLNSEGKKIIFLVGFKPTLAISRGFEPPAGHETNREYFGWSRN